MNIQYFNTPEPAPQKPEISTPGFAKHVPIFERMHAIAEKHKDKKNLVLIGHGGSSTSFFAFYEACKSKATKQVYFVDTVDPEYIDDLKKKLSVNDTLVVSVSKSGENVTQIEATLQFAEYPKLFITGPDSAVHALAVAMNAEIAEHPPVGGRFTGLTEVGLLPALLCGLPVEEMFKAGRDVHDQGFSAASQNPASVLASVLWQLEQKGIVDVFMPIYSKRLSELYKIISQLTHETFGKEGRGGSYIVFEGPEWQHHSTQRFYGGLKNVAGIFLGVEKFQSNSQTHVQDHCKTIPLRSGTLADIHNIPLSAALGFEMDANLKDAVSRGIPCMSITLPDTSEKSLAEFLAFWQVFCVYSAQLRDVNAFDQPEVEHSKEISFESRKSYSR